MGLTESQEQALQKIDHSKYTDYPAITGEKMAVLKNTICKDFSSHELYFFLNIAHSAGLNPFLKEIWGWRDSQGRVVTTTGIAGYKANASKNQDFKGLQSAVVYEGDEFSVDFVSCDIVHKGSGIPGVDRKIVGAWAKCFRDGFPATLSVVRFSEYNKSGDSKFNAWSKNPSKMILKVAEGEALAKQFPINGVLPEWETTVKNGQTDYNDHTKGEESEEDLKQEELNAKIREALEVISVYEGEDKERIGETIKHFIKEKTITIEILDDYITHMTTGGK